MALKYSSKHDISYVNYNNKNIPWQLNTTIISQNNQTINPSLNIGSINNNLVIESSQNNIVLVTPQNKKVVVKTSMIVNGNLDASNNLTTNRVVAKDISLNNKLYVASIPINIIGDIKVQGSISIVNSTSTGLKESESEFINVTLTTSKFTDVSIVNCTISSNPYFFYDLNIINSHIYNIPIGYDEYNNVFPNKASFSDVSLQCLVLNSSINTGCYIKFSNTNSSNTNSSNTNSSNTNSSNIIIKSFDDYSKLEISKPLNIGLGFGESNTNISNISIFNGDISCYTLYYSQLVPDIRLNNYFDVSIGLVSVSGNTIPNSNMRFNIGSTNYKFNEIISTQFIGDLNGIASSANDLKKNLDMSFNTLDIYGTITLNKKNLSQFVSGDLISIVAADVSFIAVNNRVRDLSRVVYSQQTFDLCLNTNFAKQSLLEASFINLNNNITSISNNVYSKSVLDLCLNRNYIRNNDVSAIASIVSNPPLIYPGLFYLNSSLNKVTAAKVANELVFPYAITYVDDNVEDTNIKESYSYRNATTVTTFNTTTTQTTTITYSYETQTRPVSGAEPNNLGENRLTMWSASSYNVYRRTWNDVNGIGAGPAVYMTTINGVKSFRVATTNPTYEYISTFRTWQDHQNAAVSSGRNLAVIINSQQQTIVRNLIPPDTYGPVYLGGRRINDTRVGTSVDWQWVTGDSWNYTNWGSGEPNSGWTESKLEMVWWLGNGVWNDAGGDGEWSAIYMTGSHNNILNLSWEGHRLNAIAIGAELAVITNATENEAVGTAAQNAGGLDWVYIGGKRKSNSSNAYGITSADWEWHNGTTWNYSNFFRGGQTEQYEVQTASSPIVSSPQTGQPVQVSSNTVNTDTNLSIVKLPLLVSSVNGSIVATATSINTPSIPANTSSNTSANPQVISNVTTGPVVTRQSSITTNTIIRSYTTTTETYTLNTGLTTGLFKISDNSNNNSNYIKSTAAALPSTITTSYSCIAVTNDGMFVALGKANDVTVYMRNSTGWSALGSPIGVQFSAYTESNTGIIPTQFTDINWRKNLQNLAINYISGENPPRIFLAFGDSRNSIKVYSYDNANWIFSNGFYSVTGGSWVLKHTHLASTLGASTNFGYFVVLSHNPRILVFTIDDRFYSYNCSDSSFNARGSNAFIRLPTGVTNFTNIIALKITSDADKIIVSNTHYVYIYKWNNASWTSIRVIDFNVTFNYGSTNNIPAGPRSLDISNINTNNNDCVFAIGFPDKLINSRANNRSRGYVEYYQCLTSSPSAIITKLATLVPRKRDINNNNVDTNEYFFSAGGIKITNANTILVSPNFKFHFNNTTKNYQYNSSTQSWTAHNTNATSVTGRTMASIENEVENELVKITGRGSNFYIGGIGAATQTGNRRGSLNWRWSNNDTFNYENWESMDRPYSVVNQWIEFYGAQGTWNNTSANRQAMYMTRSLSYSLNTFNVFDRFYFHSSGFFSSYFPTDVSNRVIARWATTDTPLNRSIEIRANGQMFSRSYGSISDIRLKENIVDVTPKLVDLLKVRVVNYNLKGCKDAKFIGVVAQELEQIFPALVKDGDLSPQDINLHKTETYKSVKYSCFDVMLIKAFQEQMAIINTLSSQLDEQEKKCKLLKIISQDTIILNNDLDFLKRENELLKLNINEILKLMTKC